MACLQRSPMTQGQFAAMHLQSTPRGATAQHTRKQTLAIGLRPPPSTIRWAHFVRRACIVNQSLVTISWRTQPIGATRCADFSQEREPEMGYKWAVLADCLASKRVDWPTKSSMCVYPYNGLPENFQVGTRGVSCYSQWFSSLPRKTGAFLSRHCFGFNTNLM